MAYVPVPKDLSKVKTKVAFNLTKRQIVCFAAALLIGLPLFFLLKGSTGTNLAAMAMIVVMLPCLPCMKSMDSPLKWWLRTSFRQSLPAQRSDLTEPKTYTLSWKSNET